MRSSEGVRHFAGASMKKHILTALLLVAAAGAAAQPAETCGAPAAIDDGWTIAKPEDVGLDGAQLCDLDGFLKPWPSANIHAVVVVRHGKLAIEHYRTGKDLRFAGEDLGIVRFTPTGKHDIRSISKSTNMPSCAHRRRRASPSAIC